MKLLIITQKVDINDPVLGFFHRWLLEFAKHCEKLTVICLGAGEHDLPDNVEVLSLGKPTHGWPAPVGEKIQGKLAALFNFYRYLFRLRRDYDAVFVHMNQEYVLLAGWYWRLIGKKILLWRNHPQGGFLTRVAIRFSHRVFCTSSRSFTARFAKTKLMPAGIDTDIFRSDSGAPKTPQSILCLGRVSPIKRVHLLIKALAILRKEGIEFKASIIGGPANPEDEEYARQLRKKVSEENLSEKIIFQDAVKNYEAPAIYNAHEIYANLTPTGSFDKTILEAMVCGLKIFATNDSFGEEVAGENGFIISADEAGSVATGLRTLLSAGPASPRLAEWVKEKHSLAALVRQVLCEE